jgi:hypothetical protein
MPKKKKAKIPPDTASPAWVPRLTSTRTNIKMGKLAPHKAAAATVLTIPATNATLTGETGAEEDCKQLPFSREFQYSRLLFLFH